MASSCARTSPKNIPKIVVAFIKAIYDAGKWIDEDPMRATEMMEKWTGVEKEVLYLYFSKGGHLTLDPTIKQKWIEALKFDHGCWRRRRSIPALDFDAWINEDYIKAAYSRDGAGLRSGEGQDRRPA